MLVCVFVALCDYAWIVAPTWPIPGLLNLLKEAFKAIDLTAAEQHGYCVTDAWSGWL
jgi:hypothetical protein